MVSAHLKKYESKWVHLPQGSGWKQKIDLAPAPGPTLGDEGFLRRHPVRSWTLDIQPMSWGFQNIFSQTSHEKKHPILSIGCLAKKRLAKKTILMWVGFRIIRKKILNNQGPMRCSNGGEWWWFSSHRIPIRQKSPPNKFQVGKGSLKNLWKSGWKLRKIGKSLRVYRLY